MPTISGGRRHGQIALRRPSGVGTLGVLQRDHNLIAADVQGKGPHRFHGRQSNRRAVSDVEPAAVARALYLAAVQFAVLKRTAVMRADAFNGVEHTADVAEDQREVPHPHLERGARRELGNLGDGCVSL